MHHLFWIHEKKYNTISKIIHHIDTTIHHNTQDRMKGNADKELQPWHQQMDLNAKSKKHYHPTAW